MKRNPKNHFYKLVLAVMVVIALPAISIADEFINGCTIEQVAAAYGDAQLRVSGCKKASDSTTVATTTYVFAENIKNSGMATALTALSLGNKLNIKVQSPGTSGSTITVINLNK
jgi:hypothetical protein